jgi:hypothetical protein
MVLYFAFINLSALRACFTHGFARLQNKFYYIIIINVINDVINVIIIIIIIMPYKFLYVDIIHWRGMNKFVFIRYSLNN